MKGLDTPCDLHIHSYYSDGNLSPERIAGRASLMGLSAISLTDHDTLSGQGEVLRAGEECGVEVLSGIEFSVKIGNLSVHILGYLFDPLNRNLIERTQELEIARRERARLIVEKLNERGIDVSFAEVVEESGRGVIGRPHIARIMLRKGLIDGVQEAFDRYIGDGRPCYVPKKMLPLDLVIRLVREAGGVTVWAHPGNAIRDRSVLDLLCELGIAGLEVWHPNHSAGISDDVRAAARQKGLICTGGSDYHFAEAMKADIGEISIPYQTVLDLKKAAVAGC